MNQDNYNKSMANSTIQEAYFFAELDNVTIKDDLREGIKISDLMFLCNSSDLGKNLFHEEFEKIGQPLDPLDGNIRSDLKPVFIYAYPENVKGPSDILVTFLEIYRELEDILMSIWLFGDNNINLGITIAKAIIVGNGKKFKATLPPHLGYPNISSSSGDNNQFYIKQSDIILIKENYSLLSKILYSKGHSKRDGRIGRPMNRLAKIINFIKLARSQNMIPMKITLYISAIECLFAKSPDELSYKLALRNASFLTKEHEERYRIFKTIRKAYKIRSKTVHGQSINLDEKEMKEISHLSTRY